MSIYLTGSGKSFLIASIAKIRRFKVLATTGMAAKIVGGNTIQRFFNITDPSCTVDQLVTLSLQDRVLRERLE